ncbi:MAG: precorrin-3B C(17)-methyltransferase [Lachnospiraceae bacterium]|nr:precorrin-3B C(17)-methyltransferase [Lachnospiraceae bacterium]
MGTLYVVGIGPGGDGDMSIRAIEAIKDSELIVGYTAYIKILKDALKCEAWINEKVFFDTGMTGETKRCKYAIEEAVKGRKVSVICTGDAGVYGMASPVFELLGDEDIRVEVIPGITAACSGAAILGAPLSNDFCVISLSDRLTPQEVIEKRLKGAATADFPIVFYNPASKGRPDALRKAVAILKDCGVPETTVCGIAHSIGREGERVTVTDLGRLCDNEVTMSDTVFIGNSLSYEKNGNIVTPRGYKVD